MKDIHTLRNFKSEILLPKIAMRPASRGSKEEPIRTGAREEAERILKEHRPPIPDGSVKKAVREVLRAYDLEVAGAVAPTDYLDRFD